MLDRRRIVFEPGAWKHLYDVWTTQPDCPDQESLRRRLPDWIEDHHFVNRHHTEPWWTLWLVDEDDHPVVQVEHGPAQGDAPETPWDEETDADILQLLDDARSRYILSIREDTDAPVHAVQAALSVAWALLSERKGLLHDLSALRLFTQDDLREMLAKDSFAIEDHVSLHLVTHEASGKAWLHSHGMDKFGRSDLETFDLDTSVGRDAGKLMNQLCLSAALGTRELMATPIELPGGSLLARPASEIRPGVVTIPPEEYYGHEGPYLCLVESTTYGAITELVHGHLHRSLTGIDDLEEQEEVTRHLLPLVRNHFSKNASSKDFEYFARIPLQVQRGEITTRESVWVKITRWRDRSLRGTLASDSMLDSRMQVGVEVEFDPSDIEAILLSVFGEPVAGKHLEKLLRS